MNVTWCVHLYHPTEEVKVCLNANGVLNQTPLAVKLQLGERFAISKVNIIHVKHASIGLYIPISQLHG